MRRKLEIAANISILVVSILICLVIARRYLLPGPTYEQIHVGDHFQISGVDWSRSDRTLVLALSTSCHACAESGQFYRRLYERTNGRANLRIVAVFPQAEELGKKYVETLGFADIEVHQVQLLAAKIIATPTLILVDRSGTVRKIWLGRLDSTSEGDVMASL